MAAMGDRALDWDGSAWPVEGLGPGRRVAVWVRGCSRHCTGCMAVDLWEHGSSTPLDQVVRQLLPGLRRYPKLSITGGEPFDQAASLAELVALLRRQQVIEVLVYSGYTLTELEVDDAARALLDVTDILVDGPFHESEPDDLRWRGSDNQRVRLLSTRAARYRRLADKDKPQRSALSVQQLGFGRMRLIGIPRRGVLEQFRLRAARQGVLAVPATLREG